MLLKNLMEDKQLNFDQPLLSVRRHSPTVTSQKRDNRRIDSYSHQVRPHLPTYRSELKSGPIRNPGAVPFLWEQSPGQPKEEKKPQTINSHKPPIAPRLPPGRAKQQDSHDDSRNTASSKKHDLDVSCECHIGPSNDENVKNIESSKDPAEEKEGSDSGDSDEAYVDALDTLSRAESSFLNCSMSGLSGLEDVNVKPSGSFSRDPQTREFMMDRFLPAAKAMASETPHASKKQPVQVQIQQPNKTANQYKPSLRYGPSFAKRYAYCQDNEEGEEEESDDEDDQQANLPSVCGLLPRFCLKSSLCLLSPVPAMSVRTRAPTSSANKVRSTSSPAGSYREFENEVNLSLLPLPPQVYVHKSIVFKCINVFLYLFEQSRSDRTETKSIDNIRTAELDEDKAKLRSESGQLESLTPPFLGLKTFQEFLDDRGSPEESNSGDPVVEKILYVDTVQKVESPYLRLFSPNTQDTEGVSKSLEEEYAVKTKTEPMHAIVSPHEDLKKLHTVDGDEHLVPNAHKIDMSAENWVAEKPQDINLESTCKDNLVATAQEAMEGSEKQLSAVTWDNSKQNNSGLPAPPPLPKSPSDSWLWRTLPSMTTKHSSLRQYLGAATNPENHCFKAPTSDMKWETIVKTTKVQRRHMHYSEVSLFVAYMIIKCLKNCISMFYIG